MHAPDHPVLLPPFTGMALDRASTERKEPEWVRRRLDDPAARAVTATHEGVAMTNGGEAALLRSPLPPEARDEPVLLGLEDGAPLFAVDLEALPRSEQLEMVEGADGTA